MTRVAIIAAMAGELKPLVRGWAHERRGSSMKGSGWRLARERVWKLQRGRLLRLRRVVLRIC